MAEKRWAAFAKGGPVVEDVAPATGRKLELPNLDRVCDRTPAVEVYDKGRYFAVTGWRLAATDTALVRRLVRCGEQAGRHAVA